MRISIDLDETLWGLVEPMLDEYNEWRVDCGKPETQLEFRDLTDYELGNLKCSCGNFFLWFANERMFKYKVKPYPGAVPVINLLKEAGHEIYFITAGESKTIPWRFDVLKRYFDWFEERHLIKCQDKHLVSLDILIDDNPANFTGSDAAINIMKNQPWNKTFEYSAPYISFIKCDFWSEIYTYFRENEII